MPPLYSMPSAKKRHNHAGTTDERTQPISDHSEAAKHPQEAWRLERGCWVIRRWSGVCSLNRWLWCCNNSLYLFCWTSEKDNTHMLAQLRWVWKKSEAAWWCERCICNLHQFKAEACHGATFWSRTFGCRKLPKRGLYRTEVFTHKKLNCKPP